MGTFLKTMGDSANALAATITQKLVESGEKDRLKDMLRARLIECGWRDSMKAHCKEIIAAKGAEHTTVEDLVKEITPKGRATVPEAVKSDLNGKIRTFLQKN